MHTSLVRRRFWTSMRRRTNYTTILGCNAVCVVVWEPYGSGRCSVLALTGVFRFLLVSQVWLRGLSKGLGPENFDSKRGRRIREGPNDGRTDVQPSSPLVRTLSSQLVFENGGV